MGRVELLSSTPERPSASVAGVEPTSLFFPTAKSRVKDFGRAWSSSSADASEREEMDCVVGLMGWDCAETLSADDDGLTAMEAKFTVFLLMDGFGRRDRDSWSDLSEISNPGDWSSMLEEEA